MLLVLMGYPKSGKTTFAKSLAALVPELTIIHPIAEDYLPKNIDSLSEDKRKELKISAWKSITDEVSTAIKNNSNDVLIIYDTCGANSDVLCELWELSMLNDHVIISAYISAPMFVCRKRSNINKDIIRSYADRFKAILPVVKLSSNYFFIVHDSKDPTSVLDGVRNCQHMSL